MNHQADRHWRERTAVRYLDALDAGDLGALDDFWERAGTAPDLLVLLRELTEGIDAEDSNDPDFAAAGRVLTLAHHHLPTAFPPEEVPGPLLAVDVARRLEAEPEFRRLSPADRAAHARMLAEASPVPEDLHPRSLDGWFRTLGAIAGPSYAKLFRKVSLLLELGRGQQEVRLAAARRADTKSPADDTRGGPS